MKENYKMSDLQNDDLNLLAIVHVLKTRWYWFGLSVLSCIGVVWLYYQFVPPVFKQSAMVLVKDKGKAEDAFVEKQLFDVSSNLANEQLIFKSRLLMTDVVKRLGLETEYMVKDGLSKKILYPDIPVSVSFGDGMKRRVSFSLVLLSASRYRIGDLEEYPDWSSEGTFGAPLKTPAGEVTITTTPFFDKSSTGKTIYVTHAPANSVASRYLGNLAVEKADKDATLLEISYQDENTDRADAIIMALIASYNADAARDKSLILQNTALFIDDRLRIINRELGDVDGNIESYKKSNKLTDLSSEANMYLNNNNTNRREIIELSNQMELVDFIKGYLNNPSKGSALLPANSGIMDTGVEGFISQYNENVLLREKLQRSSGKRNPAIETLDEQIASLKATIIHSLNNVSNALQIKLDDARRQEELTDRYIGTVPTQERYILSVERQQKIKEELYLYLLNKREENALSMATIENKVRVIDLPYASGQASGMSPAVLFLAAFIVGLLIPGIWFYIEPMLDLTVRSRQDVKDVLTIPFLGEIPRKKKAKETIVIDKDVRDGVSEAFRVLRSNLDYVLLKSGTAPVLMFTSANPGSGKTFISSNLAVSLSMTGKRTLLLDMDIRKGSGRKPDGSVYQGITNYLSGKVDDWQSLVHNPKEYPDFYVIHSGPVPPNPAELLLYPRLDELIGKLKQEFDYIIIDTVPYGIMADAQIINRMADVTVYVIREGLMDRRMLPDVENLYKENKLRNMTVVLNDSGIKGADYGHTYTHYTYNYKYREKNGKK